MDILSYKLAEQFAKQISAGFSKVEVDGMTINFTLNDGTKTSLTVPAPADGVGITNVYINDEGHLICGLTAGKPLDAGVIPFPRRGIDYWTEEDKEEMRKFINQNLKNAFTLDYTSEPGVLIFKRIGLNK